MATEIGCGHGRSFYSWKCPRNVHFIHEWGHNKLFYSRIWSQQMFLYMKNSTTDFCIGKYSDGNFMIKVTHKFYCCRHIMLFFMNEVTESVLFLFLIISTENSFYLYMQPKQIPLFISTVIVLCSFENPCIAAFRCEITLLCGPSNTSKIVIHMCILAGVFFFTSESVLSPLLQWSNQGRWSGQDM
jgi:hypothetical protein